MATYYARQFIGVADGTKIPADRADGRQVGAMKGVTVATKDYTGANAAAPALVAGDKIYLGKLRAGELLTGVRLQSDTSWGTTTISIGTLASPAKYVNADTMTAVNRPTDLALLASAVAAGPLAADEDVYATIAVAGVAAAVVANFMLERSAVH